MSMLRLEDVRKTYAVGPVTVEVLKGVSLDVRRGDMLSIMGPSGCGKTTLMNVIGLLDRPTDGSYLLEGREVASMGDDELSTVRGARIGFVFQSYHLLPRMTARENVGLPLTYRGFDDREVARRSREALDKVGMADRTDHWPHELSGGQQQRVAIARALAGEPAIVLADEPTGALDARTGEEIMRLFVRLNEEEGITVVIVTHDREVAGRCTRRTRMGDGTLREEAGPRAAGDGRRVRALDTA